MSDLLVINFREIKEEEDVLFSNALLENIATHNTDRLKIIITGIIKNNFQLKPVKERIDRVYNCPFHIYDNKRTEDYIITILDTYFKHGKDLIMLCKTIDKGIKIDREILSFSRNVKEKSVILDKNYYIITAENLRECLSKCKNNITYEQFTSILSTKDSKNIINIS